MPEGIPTAAGGHTATTNSTTDQPTLAVTQADREMAAFIWFAGNSARDAGPRVREMLDGENDGHLAVQACARHRTNSEPRPAGDLREALKETANDLQRIGWHKDRGNVLKAIEVLATHSPAPMALQIGDRVKVAEGAEFAVDWQRMDLWVSGLAVDERGRGINVTVSEQWPIPSRHSRGYMGQTDGFIVDRTDGSPDDLTRVAHPSTQEGADRG